MFSRIVVAILIALSAAGCASQLLVPTDNDAQRSGIALDTLAAGRKLYVSHCNGCHNLYLPNAHTITEWDKILKEMKTRSKISHDEQMTILKYLSLTSKK